MFIITTKCQHPVTGLSATVEDANAVCVALLIHPLAHSSTHPGARAVTWGLCGHQDPVVPVSPLSEAMKVTLYRLFFT